MRLLFFYSLILCINLNAQVKEKAIIISGYVLEKGSKEHISGAIIFIPKENSYVYSNSYGFYSISLNTDSVLVKVHYTGYSTLERMVNTKENLTMNFELEPLLLNEIEVYSDAVSKVSEDIQMSSINLPIEQIKQIPALLGEKDVLKTLQLLPGVQKSSEGNAGIYVRGGGADQNLIILDDAPIYNANHLFGFFSVFNGDALKSVDLIKGGFPARFGGRLSSVIDLQMKDGNKKEYHAEGGIGILSSRLMIEGPILKNKCSFVVAGRRTYIDALMYPFLPSNNKFGYFFHDFNGKINLDINDKNRIFVGGYTGNDKFYSRFQTNGYQDKTNLMWGNSSYTLRWNHIFRQNLFSNLSVIHSSYKMSIGNTQNFKGDNFELLYNSGIKDFSIKYDLHYSPNNKHYIRFGLQSIRHVFTPQAIIFKSSLSGADKSDAPRSILMFENSIYAEDEWSLSPALKFNIGFRISNMLSEKNTIRPEPRLAARYMLSKGFSIKTSYSLMNQYIHLLSNTGIGLPTDLWVPSTERVRPQQSQQIAAGLAKDFNKHGISITLEGYYKWMRNVLNYKEGASFMNIGDNNSTDNINWESNITSGKGTSYGAELFIQKKIGKFSGWIGYTLSWTWMKFDSLNFGKRFPARYDRRHDISLVGMYSLNERIKLSATWVYGTGNAITMPLSIFLVDHHVPGSPQESFLFPNSLNDYGNRNSFRMAAYHRLDLGVQFIKKKKKYERIWEISIYNAYNRANPFYYYTEYDEKNKKNKLMQISLFPIIPCISWTFKF